VNVRKAVITAASRPQRRLPLQNLIDRDGTPKSVLQIIIEEALQAEIEEICVVICPGDAASYTEAAGSHARRLTFIEQTEPLGYAQALYCARDFVADEPFLHLVSDHLYVSHREQSCASQLVAVAKEFNCSVSAVQASRESQLPYFGTIGGRRVTGRNNLYEVERVVEKPTPTRAEQDLLIPGLRVGHYLCFFGMHVLTPTIMEILGKTLTDEPQSISKALDSLARQERYLALADLGLRYNVGIKYGLINAQLALALDGQDRDEVLSNLVELLALRSSSRL